MPSTLPALWRGVDCQQCWVRGCLRLCQVGPQRRWARTSLWGQPSSCDPGPRPGCSFRGITAPSPPRAVFPPHLLPERVCLRCVPWSSGLRRAAGAWSPYLRVRPAWLGERGIWSALTHAGRSPNRLPPDPFLSKPAGVHECRVAWLGHPHVLISSNFEVIPQLPHSQVGAPVCYVCAAVPSSCVTRTAGHVPNRLCVTCWRFGRLSSNSPRAPRRMVCCSGQGDPQTPAALSSRLPVGAGSGATPAPPPVVLLLGRKVPPPHTPQQ